MIDEALVELLRPLVREVVREEVGREERYRWRWASVRQAAEILDMSEEAVRMRVKRDQLPSVLLDGRRYVDLVEVDRQMGALPCTQLTNKSPRRGAHRERGHDTRRMP